MKLKLTILSIGIFAILSAVINVPLSFRGAIPYIYNFHGFILAAATTLTSIIFCVLIKKWKFFQESNSLVLCVVYLAILFIIWLPSIPFGDYLGELGEHIFYGEPIAGEESDYGWFYWDDSGMGHMRMRYVSALQVMIIQPWWTILLLGFSWIQIHEIKRLLTNRVT